MLFTVNDLDAFVAHSDLLGGPGSPGCAEYWIDFTYQPHHQVDQSIDPFSEAYVTEQTVLYEEISGRKYNVLQNELTSLDVTAHVAAANPYNHPDPAALAVHLGRLSRALAYAGPRKGDVLLDMGCGWGLSSELAAYLGLTVIAVDLNPDFVELVSQRAAKGNRAISARQSTFEDFVVDEPVDIAMFYECLHHAVRPWVVAARTAAALKPGGRLVLAGEPINQIWWEHWGLRLDPISVYCTRKFGWFESGWSLPFILQVLHRAGLVPRARPTDDPELGYAIVADKPGRHIVTADTAAHLFDASGVVVDGGYMIFSGYGSLCLTFPDGSRSAVLNLLNFRSRGVSARLTSDGEVMFDGDVPPGRTVIEIARRHERADIRLEVERWMPDEELHNGDRRIVGVHLESVEFRK